MQKVVIITPQGGSGSEAVLNDYLSQGWRILSVTAQHVSRTGDLATTSHGSFLVVLEKTDEVRIPSTVR